MAIMTYEEILSAAQQLAPEEQQRLRDALAQGVQGAPINLSAVLLALPPIDPAVIDEMERLIEEGCEQIDPGAW